MTREGAVRRFRRRVDGALIRHFGRAVGENWWMQPVSDGAGGRAHAERVVGAHC
ncbi:MAG TPA: hypothetical protein VNV83_14465 [Acidimicrobiales bacterium]|nr:hypothetical protein [Acidimicrobiales bacterium]